MKSRTVICSVLIVLSGIISANIASFLGTVSAFILSVLGRVMIVLGMLILFAVENEN